MFDQFLLHSNITFEQLSNNLEFENICKGRKGAVLVDILNNETPIIRTTTIYNNPAQKFLPIHYDLIKNIRKCIQFTSIEFNNAMIEIYDDNYYKMKYHSDQALDLKDNSYIGIFSCYEKDIKNCKNGLRKLQFKEKNSQISQEIILEHNSVILFSTYTNSHYLHKITLDLNTASNNKWLGITFRLSKTFIKFINEIPYFANSGKLLTIATEKQKQDFYKYKSLENLNRVAISEINYTISISDILHPI